MQGFNFGLRRPSAADSIDETNSRYVPSSVYSGGAPGESRATSTVASYNPAALQGAFQEDQPRYNPVSNRLPMKVTLTNFPS
jgi:hypothetical protein